MSFEIIETEFVISFRKNIIFYLIKKAMILSDVKIYYFLHLNFDNEKKFKKTPQAWLKNMKFSTSIRDS